MDPRVPPSEVKDGAAEPRFALRVCATWDETPTLRGLRLSGPAELVGQYRAPGQYLELIYQHEPSGQSWSEGAAGRGYFALAAAPGCQPIGEAEPGQGELELLVRRSAGLSGILATLPRHGELFTSGVCGNGFSLAAHAGRDLLLVAVGSGIAPLRAVMQRLRTQRQQYGHIALYYGEREETGFAYRRELMALRELGVDVQLALTRPHAAWTGGVGYVQAHLQRSPPSWLGATTAALLCGQPAMVREVRALLAAHAVPATQILLNY
jgi:NAD(P)H-flavin reductase